MRYLIYLKERIWQCFLLLILLFTVEVFLFTMKGSLWLGIYIGCAIVFFYMLTTYWEYCRRKKQLLDMEECLNMLDKKYLLPEMMEKGSTREDKKLYFIMQEMEKSMAEQVNLYKNNSREYKEYIEMWIHEVKLPIAAAKMIVENNRSFAMDSMEEELGRIEGYTEQALFYARSGHLEKDYRIKQFPLREAVNQAILHHKKALIAARAKINTEQLPVMVCSDEKWLIFILGQLISNSMKYAEEARTLELTFIAAAEKERVVFEVRDNGRGIAESDIGRVFDKGFTGSNGRNTRKSTGIGLYLCKKLCYKLGHGISIVSAPGEGTSIFLYFPKGSFVEVAEK